MLYRKGAVEGEVPSFISNFTSSLKYDRKIAKATVKVVMAHIEHLCEINAINTNICHKTLERLKELYGGILEKYPNGKFEDIHEYIEYYIINKLGEDVGGYVNLGKSRNDQVATAIRIVLKDEIINLLEGIIKLQHTLLNKAKEHVETLAPGYTHQQKAQITTLAHHFLAFYDALDRDYERIHGSLERIDASPLGSAAMVGNTIPGYDRVRVAKKLGFSKIVENTEDAIASRDFILEAIFNIAILINNISRFVEDLILWSMNELGYVELPENHVATSSIMPHKRNPVTLEVIRAKTAKVLGYATSAYALLKSLPYSYNLDLQELTPILWKIIDDCKGILAVLSDLLSRVRFNEERLLKSVSENITLCFSDLAEYITLKYNVPFRKAHRVLGEISKRKHITLHSISEYLREKLSIDIKERELEEILNPIHSLKRKTVTGSPNPKEVRALINKRIKSLLDKESKLSRLRSKS